MRKSEVMEEIMDLVRDYTDKKDHEYLEAQIKNILETHSVDVSKPDSDDDFDVEYETDYYNSDDD